MVSKDDWLDFNIGKDATLKARIGWQGLTTSEYKNSGEYYLVTGTDFENGQVGWETCHFVDAWRYEQDKNIQLKNNDVLITKDGTIGKIGFVDALDLPATLNSGIFVIRPKNSKLDQKFLYYIFTSKVFEDFLNKLTAGSTINHLYQKDFIHFSFKAPKVAEQKSIAQALRDTDDLITSLGKLIVKKEAIKQGTMQQLLTSKKRLAGFNGEWEETSLGDIAIFLKGKELPKSAMASDGLYKCIHYGELFTKYKEVISQIESKTNIFNTPVLSKKNDVLMPTSDVTPKGLATASCIQEDNVILGGDILIIRIDERVLDGRFLSFHISIDKNQILQLVSGVTVFHLYGSDMSKYTFKIPSIQEQKLIVQILSDMDDEIEMLKTKLSKTKAIKEAMMSELLTGKTRLKVTDS